MITEEEKKVEKTNESPKKTDANSAINNNKTMEVIETRTQLQHWDDPIIGGKEERGLRLATGENNPSIGGFFFLTFFRVHIFQVVSGNRFLFAFSLPFFNFSCLPFFFSFVIFILYSSFFISCFYFKKYL